MKKSLLTLLMVVISTIGLIAQDYIYQKDGNKVAAKNIEILSDITKYNKFEEEDGKVFIIPNEEISFITYNNGDVRFFERESKAIQRYNYKKNMINYHLFDLIVNNFKISYERIMSKGKIGIQIPFAVGYSEDISGYDDVQNKFYTGIGLNFYPTGQGKWRYFMGPSLTLGTGEYDHYNDYGFAPYYERKETFVLRFLVNNGVMFSPIPELSLSMVASIGIRYIDNSSDSYENIKTVGAFAFNLSYRF